MNAIASSLALCAALISSGANAALESRLGGQAVYDTDLNITWLADANLAQSAVYTPDGLMTWSQAQSGIDILNSNDFFGYHDWRLPTTLQPDATCSIQFPGISFGLNCTGSEMGHLFYNELGGVAHQSIATTHNENYSLFRNFQSDAYYGYWSGTENAENTSEAWTYSFGVGGQVYFDKTYGHHALVVRTGDVAAVPVPAAAWLLGSGLLGLISVARRKAA